MRAAAGALKVNWSALNSDSGSGVRRGDTCFGIDKAFNLSNPSISNALHCLWLEGVVFRGLLDDW